MSHANTEKDFAEKYPFIIGRSSSSLSNEKLNDEFFSAYKDAGILYMELSPAASEEELMDFERIKGLAEKYGITLASYHLPFLPFEEIDISKPDLAEYSIQHLSKLIDRACRIGISRFVIHPSGEPIADGERAERMRCAKESLARLADFAAERGATIAVENLPRTCLGRDSAEILELISAHPQLRVCFDTNHLLRESHKVFINAVCDKIVTTHISDYDFVDEKHFLPGEGKIDWQALIADLKAGGYKGIWLYELALISSRIERVRPLTLMDFARNAEELFTNKPLTVIESKPKT